MSFRLVPKSVTLNDLERGVMALPYLRGRWVTGYYPPSAEAIIGLVQCAYRVMALFCVISANSGSFRTHCVKVHVRYLIC